MLYTTYFKNISKLPKDSIILVVSLFPPKGFKFNNINIFHTLELAPNEEDFFQYKKDKDFESYINKIITKLKIEEKSIKLVNNILYALSKNKNIVLVCYEKNYLECHRYFLAKYFESLGFSCEEIKE